MLVGFQLYSRKPLVGGLEQVEGGPAKGFTLSQSQCELTMRPCFSQAPPPAMDFAFGRPLRLCRTAHPVVHLHGGSCAPKEFWLAPQVTFEDYFMTDLDIPPAKIVGYEGLIGTLLMVGVVLPIVAFIPGEDGNGLHEDSIETLHMITHSPGGVLVILLAVDLVALSMYNLAGMQVTGGWVGWEGVVGSGWDRW